MRSTLRVAMVGLRAPWGAEGGVEHAVAALSPRLVALGCEVTVYCRRRYNPLGPGVHEGVRLVDVGTVYSKHLEAIVHTGLALPAAIRRADVVHIHAMGPALWSWLPRLAGRATVATVHGLDHDRAKWGRGARAVLRAGARSVATFPDEVIVVGEHLGDHYRRRYGRQTWHIPNGVGEIAHVPLEQSGVEGLEPNGYLLFVGRLVPEKGLDRLVDAVCTDAVSTDAVSTDAASALPVVVVGGDTHTHGWAERLRARAGERVRFVGPRFGRQRDALLRHARALVLPSQLEGFPLAPLEAMAAGRPVLLSDIPPHRALLSQAPDAGWLVPADGWARAMAEVAGTPSEVLRDMGRRGEALVRERYSWDQVAARTLDVYLRALGR